MTITELLNNATQKTKTSVIEKKFLGFTCDEINDDPSPLGKRQRVEDFLSSDNIGLYRTVTIILSFFI